MRRHDALAVVVAAAAVVLGLAACGHSPAATVHVQPEVNFALPSTATGCGGVTDLAGGAARVPIRVSTVAGQVAESVNVCIDGQGPFPFVIDSGAGESIMDAHLADRLHLRKEAKASFFEGVGCTGRAQPVDVPGWTVEGMALTPQTVTAATLPDFGGKGQPVGLLGSDVLSRFGAVRVDFSAQTLTFGGPEGPPAAVGSPMVHGPVGPAPSATLTEGQSGTTVPISVELAPGQVALNVRLRFAGGAAHTFVVDTGASASVVGHAVATAAHLAHTDQAQRQTTVCSTITVPLVRSGPWSLPGLDLHPQLVGVASFGAISSGGTQGLLGSDQLKRFGWVIFDYHGGRLVLG